jgi:hypothetical protein
MESANPMRVAKPDGIKARIAKTVGSSLQVRGRFENGASGPRKLLDATNLVYSRCA